MKAVIMAGGMGSRLRPITYAIPKPLLPVGKKPIAQIIVEQLVHAGCRDIIMALEYRSDLIKAYFRDGSEYGAQISYVEEPERRGTVGALSLLSDEIKEPFLLVNGDILCEINFADLYKAHKKSGAALTVCVKDHKVTVPFGVLELEGAKVSKVTEKPSFDFKVSAGIYACSPDIITVIPRNTRYDMTDLIDELIRSPKQVETYPVDGMWFDIGKVEDYDKAAEQWEKQAGKDPG